METQQQQLSAGFSAAISNRGIVHIFVTPGEPREVHAFVNDTPIPPEDFVSLSIDVHEGEADEMFAQATLERFTVDMNGVRSPYRYNLVPGALVLVAQGKYFALASHAGGGGEPEVWVAAGLLENGRPAGLTRLHSVRVVIEDDILSATLTWDDGSSAELFSQ